MSSKRKGDDRIMQRWNNLLNNHKYNKSTKD